MADLKLVAAEVLRAGSLLKTAMSGAEIERATELGISALGMTCVRFTAQGSDCLIEVKVVLDAPGVGATEAIDMARHKVISRRIVID